MQDRELDALVAEKVMGWKWFDHPDKPIRYFRPESEFRYGAITEGGADFKYTNALPRYGTDIAAAWQVVEAMREQHKAGTTVALFAHEWGRRGYMARIVGGDLEYSSPDLSVSVHADSPARAICLAALAALGVEVPHA